ncbi:MAG: glycosyltransferase family 4 protein, partial [Caldilineaceae bacterium]|nr:glycosyltransferase family 4 protein [Caldilineaceae bacterium]
NSYRRLLYRGTDAFLAYSEMAREYLVRRGAAPARIVRGWQVVPPEQIPPPARQARFNWQPDPDTGGVTIAFVGSLTQRKGVEDLVRAFQAAGRPQDRLLILGSGPLADALAAQAQQDHRIVLAGYVGGQQRSDYLACADIFVLPSHHDPWGLVVNEAMALGLPVIVTRAAAAHEMVDGAGFVIPADRPEAIVQALSQLIDDPDLRRGMGQKARRIAQGYSVERATQGFLNVILSVILNEIESSRRW